MAAYADDTAIICSDEEDYKRALHHLENYKKAIGMARNVAKTEVVTEVCDILKLAKETGFDCPKEVKYLGCQVGINPDYRKMWSRIIGKLQAADLWTRK